VSRLRLVFCGTPQFAVPSLQLLLAQPNFEIAAVYTQPDRPSGRGQEITFSPVKQIAVHANIRVHQPEKVRMPEVADQLRGIAPDVIVIIAYGQIIPARLLTIPKHGWINLHASLLPKYRGAAPINWAIARGEAVSGNTSMRIDAGMDTGEMLLQRELAIGAKETAPEYAARLSAAGAPLMAETLHGLADGSLVSRPQNHSQATLAPILKREDGRIDWNRPANEIYDRMRGFAPWPGAYTQFRGQTCHIWGEPRTSDAVSKKLGNAPPGSLLHETGTWQVVCGSGSLFELTSVKLEGRKQIAAADFANGARLQVGEKLG
jgi:methionyl-tRNA formyltransferase